MELKQTACPACGGAVQVPPDADRVTCGYCGSALAVELSENQVELSIAKELGKALENVGQTTSESIREGATVTRAELQRLQIGQQISSLQIQLSNIRAEIRSLERERKLSRRAKRQLKELRSEEQQVYGHIRRLQAALNPKPAQKKAGASGSGTMPMPERKSGKSTSPLTRGCLFGCFSYIAAALVCGLVAIPMDTAIFNIAEGSSADGPVFTAAMFVSFIIGLLVFLFVLSPNASIWKKIPGPIFRVLSVFAPAKKAASQ